VTAEMYKGDELLCIGTARQSAQARRAARYNHLLPRADV
jgi:hypothetical protein